MFDVLNCCITIINVIFICFHVPCVERSAFEQRVADPSTPPEEAVRYERVVDEHRGHLYFRIALCASYFIKSTIAVVLVLSMFNHYDPEKDFKQIGPQLYEFTCVQTNCSSISNTNSLSSDMSALPLLAICYPQLSSIYSPIIHLGNSGPFIFTLSAFSALLLGCVLPMQLVLFHFDVESVSFFLAPVITNRAIHKKIETLLKEIAHSCLNYIPIHKDGPRGLIRCTVSRKTPTIMAIRKDAYEAKGEGELRADCFVASKLLSINRGVKPLLGDPSERLENYLQDCYPAVRTEWWRQLYARLFVLYCIVILLWLLVAVVFVVEYIQSNIIAKNETMSEWKMLMDQKNCAIWYTPELNAPRLGDDDNLERSNARSAVNQSMQKPNLIDLNEVSYRVLRWNMFSASEIPSLDILPICALAMLSGYFVVCIMELNCWLAELHHQLLLAIDFGDFDLTKSERDELWRNAPMRPNQLSPVGGVESQKRRGGSLSRAADLSRLSQPEPVTEFTHNVSRRQLDSIMQAVKERFMTETEFLSVILTLRHKLTLSDMSTKRKRRDFLSDVLRCGKIDDKLSLEFYERVYINLRMFTRYVQEVTPIVAVLNVITHLINYGGVMIALWYCKNMRNFTKLPLIIGLSGWAGSNFYIMLGAKFHASAKKIQPLVWSLIARMADTDNIHKEHLRSLFFKQARVLDYESGISLKALGIRITYVNVIQLLIWTFTVLLMAVSR